MLRRSLFFATLLTATTALAGPINYDFRFDMRSTAWNSDATSSGNWANGYRMEMKTGRLDFQGKLHEQINYRLRLRFDRPAYGFATTSGTTTTVSTSLRDSLGSYIDFAFVEYKPNENFSFQGGRLFTDTYGYEGATTSPDIYVFTDAFTYRTSSLGFGAKSVTAPALGYLGGFRLAQKFDNHEAILMVLNLTSDQVQTSTSVTTASNTFMQNKGVLGLVYKGSFFDKMWRPIISYHFGDDPSLNNATASDLTLGTGKWTWIAFGNRIMLNETARVDLDYIVHTYKDNIQTDQMTSVAGTLVYPLGMWTPQLKVAMSDRLYSYTTGTAFTAPSYIAAGATSGKVKVMSTAATIEYKPVVEANFRLHLSYQMNSYTPDSNAKFATAAAGGVSPTFGTAYTNTEVVFGMRLLGDFLK